MIKPLPPEMAKDPVYAAAFQDDCRVYSRFKLESVRPFYRGKLSLRSAYEIASASIDALESVTGVGVFDSGHSAIVENGLVGGATRVICNSFGDLERLVYSGCGDSRQFERVSLSMVSAEDDSLMVSVSPDYLRVEVSPADSKDGGRPFFAVHPLARVKKGLPASTAMLWARGVGGLASRLKAYFGSVSVDAEPSYTTISPDGNRSLTSMGDSMSYFRFDDSYDFVLVRAANPTHLMGVDNSLIPLPTGHVVSQSPDLRRFPVDAVKCAVGLGLPPQNIRLAVIVRDELDKMSSRGGPGGFGLNFSDGHQAVCDYAIYGVTKAGKPFIAFSDLQSLCGSDLVRMLGIARRIGNDGISVPADDALAADMLADTHKSERVCDWSDLDVVNIRLSECGKSRLARAVYGCELERQIEYVGRKNGSELFFRLRTNQGIGSAVLSGAKYFVQPCVLGSIGNCNEASNFNAAGNYGKVGRARAGSIIAQDISTEDRCSAP